MISAFHSTLSFPSRNFLSPADSERCICLSPRVVIVRFSPMRGIQSATVQREAKSIYRMRYFSRNVFFSAILLVAKVSKTSGVKKLGRFAHPFSFSHHSQTVSTPEPPFVLWSISKSWIHIPCKSLNATPAQARLSKG